MKKILSLVLVAAMLVMCFALTACNEKEDVIGGADDKTDIVVDDNKDKATLKMATNAYFQPYEYYQDGVIVGIDAEIAAAIAEYLDMELVIEDMQFDTIITAVKGGSVDFGMAGMTITDERKEEVNFTASYATGVQVVIVPENSEIASLDDLEGKKIGTQLGTTGDMYSKNDYGEENVTSYGKGADAVIALKGGDVDAVIIDNEPAKAFVAENEGLKILDTEYAVEDYAIAVNKDNATLLSDLNKALEKLTADGTIDAIIAEYIKAE